jgi:restriction system protein
MPIPGWQSLMKPVLQLSREEQSIPNAVEEISDQFNLTDEEKKEKQASGRDYVIRNRLSWAVKYLVEAGLLIRPRRGFFKITELGNKVLKENPPEINNKFLYRFPSFVLFKSPTKKLNEEDLETVTVTESLLDLTPDENIEKAFQDLNTSLKSELLKNILSQSPEFFEKLVVKLLQAMGYGDERGLAEAIGGTGDGGIDGVIHQDKLGLDVVYIQAKRYQTTNSVGRPDLQRFIGALSGVSATKGVFVTTSSFSSQAIKYLETVPERVVTIDGNRLVELMAQYGVGVRTENVYTINRIDEDFFGD